MLTLETANFLDGASLDAFVGVAAKPRSLYSARFGRDAEFIPGGNEYWLVRHIPTQKNVAMLQAHSKNVNRCHRHQEHHDGIPA